MDLEISNMSSVPIYQQVAVQIKSRILTGSLKNNDQLPSKAYYPAQTTYAHLKDESAREPQR